MALLEDIAERIRLEVFESEAVADHMHQEAALRAAGAILRLVKSATRDSTDT
jgi:hypothetical protein